MKRGLTDITNVMRGSTQIAKVMRGTTLIWEKVVASSYEAETIAYKNRVEADGGVVIDIGYVDRVIVKAKSLGILANMIHWTSHLAGVKKDAGNAVSKLYSFVGIDVVQTVGSSQPIHSATGITYDGDDDFLDFGLILGTDPLALTSGGTLETRIKPNYTGVDSYPRILDKSTAGSAANGYYLYLLRNDLYYGSDGVDGLMVNNIPTEYVDIAATISTTQIGYINQVQTQTASVPLPPATNANMRIGTWNHSTGRELKGDINYMRIWDVVLTPTQITEIETVV